MTRKDIFQKATDITTKDRNATHGDPGQSFPAIASMWSAYLDCEVTPHDVCAMMAMLKIARIKTSPENADNWIDLAGYAACGGELALDKPAAKTEDDDGWIEWNGGNRPIPAESYVFVRMRNGDEKEPECTAEYLNWYHYGAALDIVAYWVVK